jgi:pheromone shutdown-related protein TraB
LVIIENSDTVTRISTAKNEIILIGTAHVSRESADEVSKIIIDEKPDNVCVEIDASRYNSLKAGNNWEKLDVFKIIKTGQGFLLLANLALASFQRKIGQSLDIKPGEEMKIAVETALAEGIPFTFADRDIQITLKRAWAKSGFWGKNKLLASLLGAVFTKEKISGEDVEKMKKKSELDGMMNELADYLPSIKEVLIDERDRYLASSIYFAAGRKIVAVVGAGHVPGIIGWIGKLDSGIDAEIDKITVIPPPGILTKILPWIIPAAVLALLFAGFTRSGFDKSFTMLVSWIVINGTLSALGALAAMAHPLTILLAFLAAPITSMNPTIGVGMFTGLLEAILRKPRVVDLETLHEDIASIRGFMRNRVTHILIVFFFSSVGSSIGTFIALPYLTSLLS